MSVLFGNRNERITESAEEGLANLLICNELGKNLTPDQLYNFMRSPEYKILLSKDIVQESTMRAIREEKEIDEDITIAIINIAKNKNDKRVEDVVRLKKELDDVIQSLMSDYADIAKVAVDVVKDEAINKVPTLKNIESETPTEEE